jgi:hypothetical protein
VSALAQRYVAAGARAHQRGRRLCPLGCRVCPRRARRPAGGAGRAGLIAYSLFSRLLLHVQVKALTAALGPPWYGTSEIRRACKTITQRRASVDLWAQTIVPRQDSTTTLEQVLTSATRFGVVRGAPGTGKDLFLTVQAGRLLEDGWTVLLTRASSFSRDKLAQEVESEARDRPLGVDWRRVLVKPWRADAGDSGRGFVLLITGVTRSNAGHIGDELSNLIDAASDVSAGRYKALLACDEPAWEKLSVHRPFARASSVERPTATSPSSRPMTSQFRNWTTGSE